MTNGFSSLSGDHGPSRGNQHYGAGPGGRHLHVGEGFKLSGSVTAKNALKLHLTTPFTADNKVNPVPLLSKVLETAQMFDPNSCLKASNPALSPITKSSEIPKDEKIFKYAFDLQTLATKQQFIFFAILETSASFNDLKYNGTFFSWLQKNKFGWVSMPWKWTTSPSLDSSLASIPLFPVVTAWKKLWIHIWITSSTASSQPLLSILMRKANAKGECVNTRVTELQVDSVKANNARDCIASAWIDPSFLEVLANCSIDQSIDFVPYPKKGMMSVKVFHSAVRQQYEFNNKTVAISVIRIRGFEVEVTRQGHPVTLANLIHGLRDLKGKPIFTSIELTKFTTTEGRWLLITQKLIVEEAEKLVDNLFEQLAKEGHLDALTMEGHKIRHLNQLQSKCMSQYAEGLAKKFKPMEEVSVHTPPSSTPAHNTWKHMPKFKFDQENFPDLGSPSRTHTAKKQCCNADEDDAASQQSTTSQRTMATAMMNECTEFVQNLTASFMDQLNVIKKDHQEQQQKFEARLKAMDEALAKSQQQLITKFQNMTTKYNQAQEAYANLRNDFQHQCLTKDRCYYETQNSMAQMMQILINMNQSLADGTKPAALTVEQIIKMQNSTHGLTAQGQVTPTQSQRNGAPGFNTKHSPADPNEGGQQHWDVCWGLYHGPACSRASWSSHNAPTTTV